ncbi:formimidoylglutamate deiminase [Pseudomonas sp. CFBP 13710]|uniref:formimidoylglutamate deiminase n=1 Tax=Pseudomonas sp. CFBP 13710 TaxID=2775311 RepID=UPI00177DBFE2|nr:formimidoylglutamate deiminase [Pseudomonas sp. CFBP 13710]MBD8732790.1 formimidoylglutamate deiminase [Pseudomonas sp. CFBP 13710]
MDSPARQAQSSLFAHSALLPDGWQSNVLLSWNALGDLTNVSIDAVPTDGTPVARGPVISGMPNLHSHTFQRAMAGLTETLGDPADSFWSWRTLMYRFAQRLQPRHLQAIGRHLYIEMLKAGYTSVCEFHYVHHDADGQRYANPAELSLRVVRAAEEVGIGMTLLPVLYQYGGLGQAAPLPHQRRFINSPEWILELRQHLQKAMPQNGNRRYGVAPHSLRAVSEASLSRLMDGLDAEDPRAPVHIHIAEQTREVEECVAILGQRPVQWLLDRQPLDPRWCLVHATHMDDAEYAALARSGATVGLCPSTEANLGDGLFDAQRFLTDKGRWGIGSDSNVAVNPWAELRLLEYGQRLLHRRRNVLASPDAPVVADRLFDQSVKGGAQATGRSVAGLMVGQRADMVVIDSDAVNIAPGHPAQLLSSLVFCEHGNNLVRDVFVGGRQVIDDGQHALQVQALQGYRATLADLLEHTL